MKAYLCGIFIAIFGGVAVSATTTANKNSCGNYLDGIVSNTFAYQGSCSGPSPQQQQQQEPKQARRVSSAPDKELLCKAPELIPRACIKASLDLNRANGSTPNYNCDSDTAKTMKGERVPRACESDVLTDYISNETNRALACMNSGGEKLTSTEVFAIINHESHFSPNVGSAGGKGMMQLTSVAVNAFYTPEVQPLWQQLASNPQCSDYVKSDDYLKPDGKNKVQRQGKHGSVLMCQFLNIRTNPSRSLIMGLSLYKAYKKQIEDRLKKDGFPMNGAATFVQRLTEVAYNRGLGPALLAYKRAKNLSQHDPTKLKIEQAFDLNVRVLNDLKNVVEQQYAVFLPPTTPQTKSPGGDDEEYHPVELPEDVRVAIDGMFGDLASQLGKSLNATGEEPDQFISRDQAAAFFDQAQKSATAAKDVDRAKIAGNILTLLKTKKINDRHFTYADKIVKDLKPIQGKDGCNLRD